jgi:hypothetical protein
MPHDKLFEGKIVAYLPSFEQHLQMPIAGITSAIVTEDEVNLPILRIVRKALQLMQRDIEPASRVIIHHIKCKHNSYSSRKVATVLKRIQELNLKAEIIFVGPDGIAYESNMRYDADLVRVERIKNRTLFQY